MVKRTGEAEMSEYEQRRLQNIAQNNAVMAQLQIQTLIEPLKEKKETGKRKQRTPSDPQRRSLRAAGAEPSDALQLEEPSAKEKKTATFHDEAELERRRLESGWRIKEAQKTVWRGEVFGSVKGVEVGHVFGEGDFQRLGRQEMSETGFFVPAVQPEWCVPGQGCYAIILNNDNGSNLDQGDTVVYVGGGGRHRGQNRTAPQSFHQSWDNMTNACLKLMCDSQLPLRVVRGPKLKSPFRPHNGGFRYDGLYMVARAYEGKTKQGLRQCLFELKRQAGQAPLPLGAREGAEAEVEGTN